MPSLKLFMALGAGLAAAIPKAVWDTVIVLVVFVVLDTVTGVMVAAKARSVNSNLARTSLSSKLAQYALIAGLGWGASYPTGQPAILGLSVAACIAIEAASILENLARLERYGGAPLGPARPLLAKLSKYFAFEDKSKGGEQ